MSSRRRALLQEAPIAPAVRQPPKQLVERQRAADGTDRQQLLYAKAWNFLAGAGGVCLFPYINLYLAQRGLTSGQIGALAALRTWLASPVALGATAAADRLGIHRQLLLATCVASCALRSSLPLLGDASLLFGVLLLADLVGAPVNVLADATVSSHCNEAAGESYGKQRVFGSLGFGLASLPAGWLIGRTGLASCFLAYAAACVPLVAITSCMRYNDKQHAPATPGGSTSGSGSGSASSSAGAGGAQQLLRQPGVLLFLWRCLLLGAGMGVIANYEFMWLKHLGAPEALMGIAIAVSVTTEVPAFGLQGAALRAAGGPDALLNLGLAATALRLALYGLLPLAGPWAVLPVELLHGVTFGLSWGAAMAASTRLAPPHLAATMQGIWQATYAGVGAGLGGLLGGIVMERCGGQGLFFSAAALVAAGGMAGAGAGALVALAQPAQGRPQRAAAGGLGPKAE